MASRVLYPPIVDSYMPAFQAGNNPCRVYFSLSKFNGTNDFTSVHVSVTKQNTGMNVVKITDNIDRGRYRATGIILNVAPVKVLDEDNLYYVEIYDDDLSSQSGSYTGWIPGWTYKIQLRLSMKDYDNTIGQAAWLNKNADLFSEWSTICIVKATGQIDYQIPYLNIDTTNENDNNESEMQELQTLTLDLSGRFIREDASELIHSYCFTLYDESDKVIETSGDIYSNQYQNSDDFRYLFKTELVSGNTYKLAMKYETINKFVGGFYQFDDNKDDRYEFTCNYYGTEVPPCIIVTAENDFYNIFFNAPDHYHEEESEDNSPDWPDLEIVPGTAPDRSLPIIHEEEEEGRVGLKLYSQDSSLWSGNLCIRRSDSRTNFKEWTDIFSYVCLQEDINDIPIIYDYTIESGIWYKYGVQTVKKLNDKEIERGDLVIIGNPVLRNFNYSFLLGKDNQQLKFKFDNTMDNFRYQIYDSKIDTIGGKYPTIARNSNVYYKTFPINGTISFNMDENELFTNKLSVYKFEDVKDYYKAYNINNNIDLYDYIYEREFRNKVLEFLQDGELKLFKSPTEGNVIVRLTDVTCTPNQSLSRMIYSFTSNASEMAEATMENYLKYGFYSLGEWSSELDIYQTRLGQIYMDVPVGSNVFDLIKEKYDTRGQNIAGYNTTLHNIHHIKITFDEKPLRVQNSSGEVVVGNNFSLNGNLFTVYNPVRMYEFDNRLVFPVDTTSLIILGDAEGKISTVHVTIDFLYEATIKNFVNKQISNKKNKKGMGQIFKECVPEENLFREIYYKYYIEWNYNFSRLYSLSSLDIESNPGAAFAIKDSTDGDYETHVIGATGQLQLYEIENIRGIYYLGMQNPETGVIERRKADVLMNYLYIVQKGTYKET